MVQIDDNGVGFEVGDGLTEKRSFSRGLSSKGPTEKVSTGPRPSLGLRSIDRRLRLLYGPDYGLEIISTPGVGTTALLRIPLQTDGVYTSALSPTDSLEEPSVVFKEAVAVSADSDEQVDTKNAVKESHAPSGR